MTSQNPESDPMNSPLTGARAEGAAGPGWSAVAGSLERLGKRARLALVVHRVGIVVAWVIGIAVSLALLDYALRVPGWLRGLTLPVWLFALGWVVWKWILPAARFRAAPTQLALRVERAHADLSGRLGAAADLAQGRGALPTERSKQMADRVVREAAGLWDESRLRGLIRPEPLRHALGWAAAWAAVCVGLFILSPSMWWIGAQRVLTPWSSAEWPRRTGIADATPGGVHASGRALSLRGVLTRSNAAPDNTDVFVEYRTAEGGRPGAWRKELLTYQGREATAVVEGVDAFGNTQRREVAGALFERLVDASGDSVEFRFSTSDDATAWRTLTLAPPPALVSASATITPPAYARGERVGVELGNGTDDRGVAPTSLTGSRVELTLTLNKAARLEPDPAAQIKATGPVDVRVNGAVVTLAWQLADPVRLVVRPVDEHGLEADDDAVLRFDSTPDKPAEATVTAPPSDRGVLATALIESRAEGRDDVGLSWVALERQVFKPAARPGSEKSGPGGALEPIGTGEEIVRETAGGKALSATASLDLSTLGVKAGDEVRLFALAKDAFVGEGGERPATRSAPRTLRIISESQFIDEVRRELNQVRQGAIRVDAQQGEVSAQTEQAGADRQARRGQAQVSERISRQGEALARVSERVKENGLVDPSLAELLSAGAQAAEKAGQASSRAGKALDRAAEGRPEATPENPRVNPEGAAEAREDQEAVREEMRRLAEILDRGQDNWVVKNKLDQLVKAQDALQGATRRLSQQTAGKQASELSPAQQDELKAIVEKQTQLSEDLTKLTKEMREKAQELAKSDAAAAQGMVSAASRAEQQQVSEQMRSAASSAEQNKMNDAAQRQEQASKALKQMKEDLDAGEKQRNQVLRRKLQEVAESIERLVKAQEAEIAALAAAERARAGFENLDRGMIALNQNTLGVADSARAARELAPVAALLNKAAEAQEQAIAALRVETVDPEPVRVAENESLDALRTALDRARELSRRMDNQDQARALAELKQKYKDALDEQVRIRGETDGYARAKELSRRDKVLVRRLAEAQTALGESIRALHEGAKDLKDTIVFDYANKRLMALAGSASKALDAADPGAALPVQDAAISTIRGVLDALTDPKNDSKFSEGAGGGGSGGSGGKGRKQPLIPPAKELRLLRMMQADIAEATARANAGGTAEAVADVATLQREAADVADRLIKKMASGAGGENPEIPFGPAPGQNEKQPEPGQGQPEPGKPAEPEPEPETSKPAPPERSASAVRPEVRRAA